MGPQHREQTSDLRGVTTGGAVAQNNHRTWHGRGLWGARGDTDVGANEQVSPTCNRDWESVSSGTRGSPGGIPRPAGSAPPAASLGMKIPGTWHLRSSPRDSDVHTSLGATELDLTGVGNVSEIAQPLNPSLLHSFAHSPQGSRSQRAASLPGAQHCARYWASTDKSSVDLALKELTVSMWNFLDHRGKGEGRQGWVSVPRAFP